MGRLKKFFRNIYKKSWMERSARSVYDYFKADFVAFSVFVVFLAILFVHNGYAYEAQLREIYRLEVELNDVKNISLEVSKELMQARRQSQVEAQLRARGSALEVSKVPAVVLK